MDSSPRWRPSSFMVFSAAAHAGALSAIGAGLALPAGGPLVAAGVAALVADHLGLALGGLLPRCALLGPVMTRLPASVIDGVAITIDDGPDPEVTPRVLDLLDAAGAKATFFVIGARARQHSALTRQIAERGHAVENHSERHWKSFSLRGPAFMAREIDQGRQTIIDLTGQDSRYFRAPAGLRNPFLDPLLARRGLLLAAWTRRAYDTREGDPQKVLPRLTDGLAGGDILLLHDGHAARDDAGQPVILGVLPRLLAELAKRGLRPCLLDGR